MIDVRFLRNKEVRQFLLLYLIVTAIATVVAAFISLSAVILVLLICTVSLLLFLLFTWKRYRAISNLSSQVDSILHGEYDVNLIPDEEGELAVLSSELSKMTLRLRDQADRLEKDKRYLSDSLADISHQLRTPLTSIRMIVPRLATDDQDEEQQANVRKVDALLNRTESLISMLLKIARLESGTVQFANEPVQVESLLRSTLEPLEILLDIHHAFAATMTTRIHQLGILQSVGATPRQIKSTLVNEVVVLSLPASIVGNLIGIGLSWAIMAFIISSTANLRDYTLTFTYHPMVFVGSFGFSIFLFIFCLSFVFVSLIT